MGGWGRCLYFFTKLCGSGQSEIVEGVQRERRSVTTANPDQPLPLAQFTAQKSHSCETPLFIILRRMENYRTTDRLPGNPRLGAESGDEGRGRG